MAHFHFSLRLRSKCENGVLSQMKFEYALALMFADDVSSFADSVVTLQRHIINLIEKFCKSVGISLNLSKTKIIVFRNENCKRCGKVVLQR